MILHPRPFQIDAVDRTLELLKEHRSVLGVAATGMGKTVIMTMLMQRRPRRQMFLAHREELIAQAAKTISRTTGLSVDMEMADVRAGETNLTGKADVIVSSIQTQIAGKGSRNGARMKRFDPHEFSTLFVDEAHHGVSDSYIEVLEYYMSNPELKIIGVTATPKRKDDRCLSRVFEKTAFNYDIRYGIAEGFLVPIEQRQVYVNSIDLSAVRVTAGDFNGLDLARVMEAEKPLHGVANATLENTSNGEPTIIFVASVAQAERLAEILNRHKKGCAAWVSGKTERTERRKILHGFAKHEYQYCVNVDVLTEGYDNDAVRTVVIARPTLSWTKYVQMLGRGTRPLRGVVDCPNMFGSSEMRHAAIAASDKPKCVVLDFMGASGKHRLINTADVLAGPHGNDVVTRAKRMMMEHEAVNPIEILDKAAEQIEKERIAEAERVARIEQEKAETAKRTPIVAQVRYTTSIVDPFSALELTPWEVKPGNVGRLAMEGQIRFLKSQGVENAAEMSFTEAQQLCVELRRRLSEGLCSWKQAGILRARGLRTDVSREEAKRLIDEISVREGWKPRATHTPTIPTPPSAMVRF